MPMAVLQAYRSHMEDSVDYNAPSSPAQDEDMTSKAVSIPLARASRTGPRRLLPLAAPLIGQKIGISSMCCSRLLENCGC